MPKSAYFLCLLFFCLSPVLLSGQTDSLADPKAWGFGARGNLLINQVALSNWQAGGESSLGGTVSINLSAKKRFGRWVWDNRLDLRYGHQWLGDRSVKTDDLIDLNTRLDRRLSDRLSISLMLAFRTQFAQGFEASVPDIFVSDFLAPAYTNMGVGLTYKAGEKLSLFFSPSTAKWTLVNNGRLADNGAFGVEAAQVDSSGNVISPGKKSRFEIGGYMNVLLTTVVAKNIDFRSKLDLFSNYLNKPQNIDVNWENTLNLKVNEYVTVQLVAHLIYDNDIVFTDVNGRGPRTQFRESMGVGLNYAF
jgi:hypothetical protein